MANPPTGRPVGRPKGAHDFAPSVRGAFLRALKILDEDKRPLSILLREALERDVAGTLSAVHKYLPKQDPLGLSDAEGPIYVVFSRTPPEPKPEADE